MRSLFVAAVLFAGGLAGAHEGGPAKCNLRVVHATKDGSGVDPKLTPLRVYFEQPTFAAWHQFKLLEDKQLTIPPKGVANFDLPNGRKGTLTYVEHFEEKKEHRLRIKLTIDRPDKRMLETTFVLDESGVVLQAGQRHEGGRLILAISCKTED
jgi:hypothetical protein